MPPIKKKIPELRVVFDTSVLFTQVVYDLMKIDVKKLIEANSKHPDLSIRWYLPSIVVDERRYQMYSKALELQPTIVKLEKLLGHNLNITDDILSARVDEAIEKQLAEMGILKLEIDTTTIDWKDLIHRAVYRNPPFNPGDHEKGFRDALIAESFLQLVKQSPSTPSICRLAIVTNDELLKQFIADRLKDAKNVRVLTNVGDLGSLINTLVSTVTEEFVNKLKEKAKEIFFQKENNMSLYYKESIFEKIKEKYGQELQQVPNKDLYRENGTWWIADPVFVKKDRQTIYWMTPINIDVKLFKYEWPEATSLSAVSLNALNLPPGAFSSGYSSGFVNAALGQHNLQPGLLSAVPAITAKRTDIAKGQSRFEVHWQAKIMQNRKLTTPRVDNILFAGTKYDES